MSPPSNLCSSTSGSNPESALMSAIYLSVSFSFAPFLFFRGAYTSAKLRMVKSFPSSASFTSAI